MEPLSTTLAPPPPAPAGRQFSAGAVIGRSFSLWFRNFVPFAIVSLVVEIPVFLLVALSPAEPGGGAPAGALVNLVSTLADLVVTGALTYGVLEGLRGTRAPVGALLRKGFAKFGPVLLVAIAYGFVVLLGFVLLVVPGIIALCALYVALPAVVVEDVGPGAALGRSRALTKGSRWGILVIFLALAVVGVAVVTASGALAAIVGAALPHPYPALIATALMVLVTPLHACGAAVAYHDLRVAKEGISTADLVKVFE